MREFPLPLPFGEAAEHLEPDFAADPRPDLVTRVLHACLRAADGGAPDTDSLWRWTLHRRLQGLLAVERAGGGARAEIELRCPHAGCGEAMAIDLDLERFVLPDPPPRFDVEVAPGVRARVRLPSGEDQRRWAAQAPGPVPEQRLARDLVEAINGEPLNGSDAMPAEWLEPLAGALEERDPLTALRLTTRCPACGAPVDAEFDLEAHLLRSAAARQARLLDAVHRLARAYHWSEGEILALPRSRRQQYLERLRAEPAP
jgi:hypothetical protein